MKSKVRSSFSWFLSILLVLTMMPALALTAYATDDSATPAITGITGDTDLTYGVGGTITVVATGAGALSYQWYSDTDNQDYDGTLMPEEIGESLAIDSDADAGTYYYYCEVTNTETDKAPTSDTSAYATVTVAPKTVTLTWYFDENTEFSNETKYVYNGTNQAPTATVSGTIDEEEVSVATYTHKKANASADTWKAAGDDYTVTVATLNNANYAVPTNGSETCAYVIEPKPLGGVTWSEGTLNTETGIYEITYDGQNHNPTPMITPEDLTGVETGDSFTVDGYSWVNTTTTADLENAGDTDTATAILSGTDGGNYTISATFKVGIPVTLTATDQEIYVGSPLDEIRYTQSGDLMDGHAFKNLKVIADSTKVSDINSPGVYEDALIFADNWDIVNAANYDESVKDMYFVTEVAGTLEVKATTPSTSGGGRTSGGGGGGLPATTPTTTPTETPATTPTEVVNPTPSNSGTSTVGGFKDVKAGAYYAGAVAWAVGAGITNGTSADTFSPEEVCTRGQIVTFIWRAAGSPEPTSTVNPFTDVKAGAYYYKAVLWAVEKGVANGTSDTTFDPDKTVTRGEAVTFLYRAKGESLATAGTYFSDVDPDAFYADAVAWAAANGVTTGTSATTFSPNEKCTRGQIVTFQYRAE